MLRSMGIQVVIYIDDVLLLHQQSKVLQKIFAKVVDLPEKLGFLVKREKCSPIPCQRLIFLGAVLDSATMTLSLPQPKVTTIVDTGHHLLAQGSGSVRTLSTLIGQMSHASQTWILVAPLHCRLRSSTPTPASSVTSWAGEQSDNSLNLPGTQRPRVVSEQLPSEWLSNSAPTYQSHSLDRCLNNTAGAQPTKGFPPGVIGVWKTRSGTSMFLSYEQLHWL